MASGWKVIKVDLPDINAMLKPFKGEMAHYLEIVEKKFKSSASTWSHDPGFVVENKVKGFGASFKVVGEVYTEDDVYRYLNDGTSVRYATMTKNFSPKTKPGRISARAGSGGLHYVSRGRPRPGIKARNWDVLIADGTERNLRLAFNRAIEKSAKASRHAL
jgi:hypothetical protein